MPGLLAGLLLPWVSGFLLIAAVRQFQGHAPHPGRLPRLLGYGFFLGYALLYLLIHLLDRVVGGVSSTPVFILLALSAAGSAMLWRISRGFMEPSMLPRGDSATSSGQDGRGEALLTALLLTWLSAHLLFTLIDVLSIPVFPWDAWQLWLFRAKAWFLNHGLADVVSPEQWALASTAPPYTVDAFNYPGFLSVIVFWAASGMGHWSETLVNLPGWLCASAIGLVLYGHLLRLELPRPAALAITYLLFATPLFGAHASLGGYSDIWMAGYAGLGFVALLSGLSRRETGYILMGLVMLAFSILVKHEGLVWFLLALALSLLFVLPAKARWIVGGAAVLVIVLVASGAISHVDLAGLGPLGLVDGQLHVPLVGHFTLQAHDVLHDYRENLFLLGSWNLLWAMLLLGCVFALRHPGERNHQLALAFLLLVAGSQAFIFGFTSQGEWARQYTAINRLPLQVLPALLFIPGLILAAARTKPEAEPSRKVPLWLAPVLSLMLVAVLTSLWLSGEEGEGAEAMAPELQFVMGTGTREDGSVVVSGYQQGFALLSSGPIAVDAAGFPYLDIELASARYDDPALAPAFFWRQADAPGNVHRMTLGRNGLQRLARESSWAGAISEFGLLIPETGSDAAPRLEHFALEPATPANRWHLAWNDWFTFEPWSLRSVNFIWGGAERQDVPLPPLVLAWALFTSLLWWVFRARPAGSMLAGTAIALLAAWMVLDIRWTLNGARQVHQSVNSGLAWSDEKRLAHAPDGDLWKFIQRFHDSRASAAPSRILIVGDIEEYDYYMKRARYHLLPHSGHVVGYLGEPFRDANLDFVLFIDDFADDSGWSATFQRLPMDPAWRDGLELVDSTRNGILFRVEQ